jgi:hypothetical protein
VQSEQSCYTNRLTFSIFCVRAAPRSTPVRAARIAAQIITSATSAPKPVKRYARIDKPERIRRAPQYRPTLVDPYRDHLRKRRAEDPAVPVLQLLREIRERGYGGSQNLLYRYITQGRVEDDRPGISPRRLARMLLSRPGHSPARPARTPDQNHQRLHGDEPAHRPGPRPRLALTPADGNAGRLQEWINTAEQANLPHVHAALTSRHHNGGTEGVNTKTKLIKRQMYGRAGFRLLRHRILLQ